LMPRSTQSVQACSTRRRPEHAPRRENPILKAHLVGGAVAVLDAAQQAVGLLPLALHVQHHVHHVLQYPRPRYLPRLRAK